jgi:hypothetical protein
MCRVVGDAKFDPNHDGNPGAGPNCPSKAIGLGALVQEGRQARELLVGEPTSCPGGWMVSEGIGAAVAGASHPLTDSPLADVERFGDLALRPAPVLEAPGLEPSGFFPVVR